MAGFGHVLPAGHARIDKLGIRQPLMLDGAVSYQRSTIRQTGLAPAGAAGVRLGDGALGLKWQVGPPRVIGLISIPVLKVSFRFAGLDDEARYAFMKRFDLYMQRGGG